MPLFDGAGPRQICRRKLDGAVIASRRGALVGMIAVLVSSCTTLSPEKSAAKLLPSVAADAPSETAAKDPAGFTDSPANSEDPAVLIAKGSAQLARHQAELARATFAHALAAVPESVPALNGLGVALDMLGRHAEAQAAYHRVLANVPDDMAARNNLGLSLTLNARYGEAIAVLQPIGLGEAASPRARQNLAIAMALDGDRDGAAKLERLDMREEDLQFNLNILASMRH